MSSFRWSELPAPALRELAAQGAIALWPVGSTEQHGAHLATGFDLVSAEAVCDRAAVELAPRAVVLPGLPLGSSDHWLPLGATLSLRPQTLEALVSDVIRSVAAAGFRYLLIVNGHAGNVGPILSALGATSQSSPAVELVSYWNLVSSEELAAACTADNGGIGHAGEVETSIGLYLGDGLVAGDWAGTSPGASLGGDRPGSRKTVFLRAPRPLEESPTGVYGDPRLARAELGKLVIEGAAAALVDHCRSLLSVGG